MSDRDNDSIGGRVRRYAQVGTAMGGLAVRFAGERYLGLKGDPVTGAADLRAALGGLKGPLMKVAQILATVPDALPKEYALELAELQSNAPQMGWPFVKRRMATELGPDWAARFRSFGREATAAASLGQVHRAVGPDGRDLACKLQYPEMASAVEADLQQLKLVFALLRRADKSVDPSEMHAEIAARLREELDYGLEARHMVLYRHMLAREPGVVVPEVVPELSTRRLLTMTWCGGRRLRDVAAEETQERRNAIAYTMFRAWYVPFYEYGVIHGDPHLGNYTVRPDGSINLYDFGSIRVFRPSFVKGVIDLYFALRDDDPALAVSAYETWGFRDLSRDVIAALNLWARYVYGPLMKDRVQRIQHGPIAQEGRERVETVRAELRRLGGVKPPREFVLMDRAAIGLGAVFMHLGAEINWYQLFHDLIRDFDVDALARRQAEALADAGMAPETG